MPPNSLSNTVDRIAALGQGLDVHDGDIITADHYNNLWRALHVLASVGGGAAAATDFPIVLHPARDFNERRANAWESILGGVRGPDPDAPNLLKPKTRIEAPLEINGWMPLDLAHGAHVAGVSVRGLRSKGSKGDLTASLRAVPLGDPENFLTVFESNTLGDQEGRFDVPLDLFEPDAQRVDRSTFQYAFQAKLEGADDPSRFELHHVQVSYR